MNTTALIGRLVSDPELRTTPSGEPACGMRLAVDRMGHGDLPGYIDVTVWGRAGQAADRVLRKGWLVGAHGRLEHREWTGKDGSRREALQLVGNVDFLAAPRDDGSPERSNHEPDNETE